jgi:hypothetical protein
MKLVVNSAYGYLAAGGGLTRFADVHAANEVTRRGRETLDMMCRELAARGVTLLYRRNKTNGAWVLKCRLTSQAEEGKKQPGSAIALYGAGHATNRPREAFSRCRVGRRVPNGM